MHTGPEAERHALDAALAELETHISQTNRRSERFATNTGYTATLSPQTTHEAVLTLTHRGLTSQFFVRPDGVRFRELRGPDTEHVREQPLIDQHLAEAWRLFETGALTTPEEHRE